MDALTGTFRLLRLSLRLDKVRLPIWIAVTIGLVALTLPQLQAAYGSEMQRTVYATATSSSPVSRLLGGALTGPSMGEITIIETYAMIVILVCLMNIFLINRHTRQNEEAGRSELIGSAVVGRQAPLTASLILALAANTITALLLYAVYIINGFAASDSAAYSLGIGAAGMLFAAIAAITAQLFENARAVSGVSGLLLGTSFMIRGVGDMLGELRPDGLGTITSAISWLSPLGWVTNMRLFTGSIRWWILGIFILAIISCVTVAYVLLSRRDIGSGLFAARAGKVHAKPSLLQPFGLIWRLNRVSFIAWLLAFMATGATLGGVANEFGDLIAGNEEMQKLLASIGGSQDPSNIMFSAMFTIIGITASAYALQVLTRMKSEETSARLEVMLATPLGRVVWLVKYVFFALFASFIILLLTGFSAGLLYGLATNDLGSVARLSGSILVHFPAVAVLTGASIALFGAFKQLFVPLTWTILALCLLIFQLGALLDLPQFIMNISPFTHTPPSPAASISCTPLIVQAVIALGLLALGTWLFTKRDLATG